MDNREGSYFHDIKLFNKFSKWLDKHNVNANNKIVISTCNDKINNIKFDDKRIVVYNNDYYIYCAGKFIQECQEQNRYANLIFNKPNLPLFCNDAKVLTVLLTTEQEQNWVYRALWSKHFIETDNEIIYAPSSPDHCHLSTFPKLVHYKPKYRFDLSERKELYNREVVNNQTILNYKEPHDLFNNNVNNIFFNISDLFDVELFISAMEKVFNKFELGMLDCDLVSSMYQLWWSRQHAN